MTDAMKIAEQAIEQFAAHPETMIVYADGGVTTHTLQEFLAMAGKPVPKEIREESEMIVRSGGTVCLVREGNHWATGALFETANA